MGLVSTIARSVLQWFGALSLAVMLMGVGAALRPLVWPVDGKAKAISYVWWPCPPQDGGGGSDWFPSRPGRD
jgi:hypothetical protein